MRACVCVRISIIVFRWPWTEGGEDLYDLSRTNLDPIARIFATWQPVTRAIERFDRSPPQWKIIKPWRNAEIRFSISRRYIYIYICSWKYTVAFCSNRGIVSSRLIVQIFTRIFLSFSLSNFVESFHCSDTIFLAWRMNRWVRMKYFGQQRAFRVTRKGDETKISTLRYFAFEDEVSRNRDNRE